MDFLERDLEDILFNSDRNKIQERGLRCFYYDSIFRQVNIDSYGIIDLVTIKISKGLILIHCYELKNKKINAATFWQTIRYIKAIKHVVSNYNLKNHLVVVLGVMIGREVDQEGEFCFLPTINSDISMFTYSYGVDGISFDEITDSYVRTGYNYSFNLTKLTKTQSLFSSVKTILDQQPF